MASEERFSYEETKHLFNPDQDGATCQHVWRLQANPINWHQITRVCVICHTSSGFPDGYDFLRGNYTNAENENLRHYLELKQREQRLAEARALLEEATLVIEDEWGVSGDELTDPQATLEKLRAFLGK